MDQVVEGSQLAVQLGVGFGKRIDVDGLGQLAKSFRRGW